MAREGEREKPGPRANVLNLFFFCGHWALFNGTQLPGRARAGVGKKRYRSIVGFLIRNSGGALCFMGMRGRGAASAPLLRREREGGKIREPRAGAPVPATGEFEGRGGVSFCCLCLCLATVHDSQSV
jgi:hypothetical protein